MGTMMRLPNSTSDPPPRTPSRVCNPATWVSDVIVLATSVGEGGKLLLAIWNVSSSP